MFSFIASEVNDDLEFKAGESQWLVSIGETLTMNLAGVKGY
jgi:hypothetical protein